MKVSIAVVKHGNGWSKRYTVPMDYDLTTTARFIWALAESQVTDLGPTYSFTIRF